MGWALAVLLLAACSATSTPNYSDILVNRDRPEAERALDAVRKPHEVMAFYEVRSGSKVADIFASRGYYTAILSQLVGPGGLVYSANPAARQELHDRVKQPNMANVRIIDGPFDKLALPQDGSLDFVLLHLDYHEIAADVRGAMNKRIFAALKRGGSYGVVDHSAKEGAGDSEAKTLHRMDKLLVIKEATSVGFV
jgi:predicted methyltransferase